MNDDDIEEGDIVVMKPGYWARGLLMRVLRVLPHSETLLVDPLDEIHLGDIYALPTRSGLVCMDQVELVA